MSLPSIAVIVPAYNSAVFFPQMMATIRAQQYSNLEVILVDDGSSDDLAQLVEAHAFGPRVRYLRQTNQGPSAARNLAIEQSESNLVAFLDMDDLWAPGHLHRLCGALAENPQAAIAQGSMRNFVDDTEPQWCSPPYRFFNLGCLLLRRQVFDLCGTFDVEMRFGEDYDFMLRCWESNIEKVTVDELSLLYRRHATNMTNGKDLAGLVLARVYKKRLDRARRNLVTRHSVDGLPDYLGQAPTTHCGERTAMDQELWLSSTSYPCAEQPLVSVVMPHRDCHSYLGSALRSILAQSHRPLEILFVDDGSQSHAGMDIAASFGEPVYVLPRPALGPAAARNAGIVAATGEYLAFLDADDLWSNDKLRVQLHYLDANPEVDAVFGHVRNFHSPELTDEQKASIHCPPGEFPGGKQCAMLIRRASFDRVGLLDERLFAGDFADWCDRAKAAGLQIATLPDTQVYRRLHLNNLGRRHRTLAHANYLQTAKQIIERRRQTAVAGKAGAS